MNNKNNNNNNNDDNNNINSNANKPAPVSRGSETIQKSQCVQHSSYDTIQYGAK